MSILRGSGNSSIFTNKSGGERKGHNRDDGADGQMGRCYCVKFNSYKINQIT